MKEQKGVWGMFGLFQLLVSGVLFVNAMAVLHEDRFLKPMGYGAGDSFPGQSAVKVRQSEDYMIFFKRKKKLPRLRTS